MNVTIATDEHNGVHGTILNIIDKSGVEIVLFVPPDKDAWNKLENICSNIIDIAYEASQEL